jgi:hypothetical protein
VTSVSIDEVTVDPLISRGAGAPSEGAPWLLRRGFWRDWSVWALLAILVTATVIRAGTVSERGLWVDELITLCGSTGYYSEANLLRPDTIHRAPIDKTSLADARPWWWIWTSLRGDSHPPLYLVVLRFWREAFGEGDVAARSLSMVASLVALVLVFDTGRVLMGRAPAVWAALLMALAAQQVFFAQEVRPYAWMVALGVGACSAMARLSTLGPNWRRAGALSLCTLALALSHYFAAGALFGLGLYALLRLRGRMLAMALGAFAVAGCIFCVVWLPQLSEQMGNTSYAFLIDRGPHPKLSTLERLAVSPLRMLSAAPDAYPLRAAAWAGSACVLVLPLLLLRRMASIRLPYLWMVGALAMPAALDLARGTMHMFWPRYVILASPGLYLLLAAPAGWMRESQRLWRSFALHAIPAAALAVGVLAPSRLIYWNTSDFRGFAHAVQAATRPGDLLIFPPFKDEWLPGYAYAAYRHYGGTPDRNITFITQPLSLPSSDRPFDAVVIRDLNVFPGELLPGQVPASMQTFRRSVSVWRLANPVSASTSPSTIAPAEPSR